MRAIYVPLPEDAVERLRDLATAQRRDTRQQAAVLILDGLRRVTCSVGRVTDSPASPEARIAAAVDELLDEARA